MNSEADLHVTKRRGRSKKNQTISNIELVDAEPEVVPKTPLRKSVATARELNKTPSNPLTPSRRSVRKSIKPRQDYDEIILKKNTVSSQSEDFESNEEHKWTPAKVGRVSQKRSTRKGRSGKKSALSKFIEAHDETLGSSNDSENKSDEPDDFVEATEELENIKSSPAKKGYSPKHSTLKDQDDQDGKKSEVSKNMEACNETFESSEDRENIITEPEEIVEVIEKVSEDILNATFDKEAEENLDVQIKSDFIENQEVILGEKEIEGAGTDVAVEAEVQDLISVAIEKERSMDSVVLKMLSEGNELGCTPILYDDNNEVEKEVLEENEIAYDGVAISNNETFEKPTNHPADLETCGQVDMAEEVTSTLLLEDSKKDIIVAQTETEAKVYAEQPEKLKEESAGQLIKPPIVYESIDLASEDEMPCLVLSDDEEITANGADKKGSANDTFNMSDCIEISSPEDAVFKDQHPVKKVETKQTEQISSLAAAEKKVKQLQENYFSPTQKPVTKVVLTTEKDMSETLLATSRLGQKTQKPIPKVVLTTEKDMSGTLLATPRLGHKRQNIGTPVSINKRQYVGTPLNSAKRQIGGTTPASTSKLQSVGTPSSTNKVAKKQPKGYRFPTPFKSKKDFRFGAENENENNKENNDESAQELPTVLTTLEPKEIILRSIRKRSLSVTIGDGDQRKRRALNVTFFSPANQTATIADLDEKLAKSVAKTTKQNADQTENVTRRKRSISLDDNFLRSHPSKLPIPVKPFSPKKSKVTTRTKLPNFAAIHQQQFKKMENLVDYVARKAERAQNLTNSALKARNAAAPSPAAKKEKPNASKALILTSSNKDTSNAGRLLVLTPTKNNVSNISKANKSILDKLNQRTKRHMDMFKACPVESKSATGKNKDIIRGVRSNRRFELMMQHRKTSGN